MSAPDLYVERDGEGTPVVLLHGLTATHRYVVHGSKSLQRSSHDVIAYDARGHGRSAPADAYDYASLAADLGRVMDDAGVERAVLAGASMGAHTLLRFALDAPERVAGLVAITPAWTEDDRRDPARRDALAAGLRDGGVEGFVAASHLEDVPDAYRDTVARVLRQRIDAHEHPGAVADALEQVTRSAPFDALDDLGGLPDVPALVVGSRDVADPDHPLAVAERYAAAMPGGAKLAVEDEGESPLAWRGGRLSALIAEICDRASLR